MPKLLAALPLAALLAACQPAAEKPRGAAPLDRVPSFAQAICGDCHALAPPDLSPDPEAPAFVEIANRPGLTHDTLFKFLNDAHNYPDAMDFDLNSTRVAELTSYIMTLQDDDYELPNS